MQEQEATALPRLALGMHLPCFVQFLHLIILVLLLLYAEAGDAAAVDQGEFIYDGFSDGNLTVDGSATILDGLLSLNAALIQVKRSRFLPLPSQFHRCFKWLLTGIFVHNIYLLHHGAH